MQRTKRGYYIPDFKELMPNPGKIPDQEILDRYVQVTEKVIRENPSNWLWFHNRWKRNVKIVNPENP